MWTQQWQHQLEQVVVVKIFLLGSSLQKDLAKDFVDERAAEVRERIRQVNDQERLSVAAKRVLTEHNNKGFL